MQGMMNWIISPGSEEGEAEDSGVVQEDPLESPSHVARGPPYSPTDTEVLYSPKNGEESSESRLGSPSYSPVDYSPDGQYSPSDLEGYRTHSEGVARRALLEPGQKRGIVRKGPDNEDTSPERGGEGGQGSEDSHALRKCRLRMEAVGQVAGGLGIEVDAAEEDKGTGRAPTDEERVRREGFVALAEYNWPLAIHGGAHGEQAWIAIERWDRSTRTEQDPQADEIANEVESFLGACPMLREVFDAQAGRGVSQRAGGQDRRAVRLTCELQALPGGQHVTPERAAFLELINHRVLSGCRTTSRNGGTHQQS